MVRKHWSTGKKYLSKMRLIILLLILSSCSSTFHLKKAIKKDPEILQEKTVTDTITIATIDSIPYVVNDTVRYTYFKTTTDTLIEFRYKYIKPIKTRQQIRLKSKQDIKVIKSEAKNERVKTRQTNKRGGWQVYVFLFIIGLLCGMFFILLIRR